MRLVLDKLDSLNRRIQWNWLSAAVAIWVYAQALDFLTTYIAVDILSFHEGNTVIAGPNGEFLAGWALAVKLLFTLLFMVVPSYIIYRGTESLALASLPFWYKSLDLLFTADTQNLGVILERVKNMTLPGS